MCSVAPSPFSWDVIQCESVFSYFEQKISGTAADRDEMIFEQRKIYRTSNNNQEKKSFIFVPSTIPRTVPFFRYTKTSIAEFSATFIHFSKSIIQIHMAGCFEISSGVYE